MPDTTQLTLFPQTTTPLAGDLVTSLDVFQDHVCSDVKTCPLAHDCMLQPIGPHADCLLKTRHHTDTRTDA